MRNAVLEREVLRRSAHVYAEKSAYPDESVMALLTNRARYIAQSAERVRSVVGPLPNRPVERDRALVPLS